METSIDFLGRPRCEVGICLAKGNCEADCCAVHVSEDLSQRAGALRDLGLMHAPSLLRATGDGTVT